MVQVPGAMRDAAREGGSLTAYAYASCNPISYWDPDVLAPGRIDPLAPPGPVPATPTPEPYPNQAPPTTPHRPDIDCWFDLRAGGYVCPPGPGESPDPPGAPEGC